MSIVYVGTVCYRTLKVLKERFSLCIVLLEPKQAYSFCCWFANLSVLPKTVGHRIRATHTVSCLTVLYLQLSVNGSSFKSRFHCCCNMDNVFFVSQLGPDTECTATSCANDGECIQGWNTFHCDCNMTSFIGRNCSEGLLIN